MDNDGIHKFAYRLRALFADLLRLVAPALAAELDFAQAAELPTAYVEPVRGGIAQRFGDMAWRVPSRRLGSDGAAFSLIVVIEFQATVNRHMARRMREYRRLARERYAGGEDGHVLLLPIVLYNGSERWTAPGAAAELPAALPAAAQLTLAPFQGWDYVLYSLERLRAGGGLARLPPANRAAATLRLQAEPTAAALLARLQWEWARFPGPAEAATRRVLHEWTGALLADMGSHALALPTMAQLEGLEGGKEMPTVSQALLSKWYEGWNAERLAEGRAQERTRSLARVSARLRRQAAIKFGPQTEARLAALLGSDMDVDQLERLDDLASEWMMECEHGEDLLAKVSGFVGNGGAGR